MNHQVFCDSTANCPSQRGPYHLSVALLLPSLYEALAHHGDLAQGAEEALVVPRQLLERHELGAPEAALACKSDRITFLCARRGVSWRKPICCCLGELFNTKLPQLFRPSGYFLTRLLQGGPLPMTFC